MNKYTMYNYIKSQHVDLKRMSKEKNVFLQPFYQFIKDKNIQRIYLLGSGTSLNAAYSAKSWFVDAFDVEVYVMIPTQFTHYEVIKENNVLCIGISQSGTSFSTIEAMKKAKTQGFYTIALTSCLDSLITHHVDLSLLLNVEREEIHVEMKGYTATLLTLYYMCYPTSYKLDTIINDYENYYKLIESWYENNKEDLLLYPHLYICGYNQNYGTVLEGTLKMHETIHRPVLGYEFEEMMHGPHLALKENSYVIMIGSEGIEKEKFLDYKNYYLQATKHVYCLSNDENMLSRHDLYLSYSYAELSVFVYCLVFQILAARICLDLNIDTSKYPLKRKGLSHDRT